MPLRARRKSRSQRARRGDQTRAQLIRELVDGIAPPDVSDPLLATLPEAERASIVSEAWALHFKERAARRLPILRERLETLPIFAWGEIFCEAPELEDELTDEQRRAWDAWCAEVRRKKLRETRSNVLAMEASEEIS